MLSILLKERISLPVKQVEHGIAVVHNVIVSVKGMLHEVIFAAICNSFTDIKKMSKDEIIIYNYVYNI
jgi:hypothetical protein